jgi:hypothetical protein
MGAPRGEGVTVGAERHGSDSGADQTDVIEDPSVRGIDDPDGTARTLDGFDRGQLRSVGQYLAVETGPV